MIYYFRGVKVFVYDPKTKQMEVPNDEDTGNGNFNFCRFIPEDYELFAKFFETAHKHATGEITDDDLKDVEVN